MRCAGVVMMATWLIPVISLGQNLVRKDTIVLVALQSPGDTATSLVRYRLTQDIEYSLFSASLLFGNWQQGSNANIISVFHHLKYRSLVNTPKKLRIHNTFTHELGIQYFFDSITRFHPDENTLDTRAEVKIGKRFSLSLISVITTRLFNSWVYKSDTSGNPVRSHGASFLTPLLWTFSAGAGCVIPRVATLSIGISAGKFTFIRDRAVYSSEGVDEFYGVRKTKRYLIEYGLSLHLLVDCDLLSRVHWNCDLLVFKNYRKPVDLVMNNLIAVRINKFLKASIQTRLYYEKEQCDHIQVENLVSIGFYFTLLQTVP